MIKEYWQNCGRAYNRNWQPRLQQILSGKELDFINKYLPVRKDKKVLDLGFGTGRILNFYLTRRDISEIYGLDYSSNMLAYSLNAYGRNPRIKKLVMGDISTEEIPFACKFDFITVIRVLKYNPNWQKILYKLIRSLNTGGILVFTMPNAISLSTIKKEPVSHTTPREIEQLCRQFEIDILEMKAFNKIPNSLYVLSNNYFYVKLVLILEKILSAFLGNVILGKCLFVAVRKK